MNLFDQVSNDIKSAMLAKDKVRLEALRGIKKEFLEAKTAKGADGELTDDMAIYTEQNRPDLAEQELAEAAVIETYLPKQMNEEELTEALKAIIAQVGATTPQEMGKVMGVATKQLAGRADGRAISAKVKELLA